VELPAGWVERYLDRSGGWRLAPAILVDQLAGLRPGAAPLVLIPRRQARKLNGAMDFLGEPPDVILHPDDATVAGAVNGQAVVVRTDRGQLVGRAKVDASIRRGVVSVPHGHHGANVNVLTDKDVLDPVTGMVLDLKELKEILEREITQRMDHRFLNYEVPELKGQIPTCENIVRVIWNLLEPKITQGKLHKVRLYETPDLFAECYRNGAGAR